MPGASPRGKHRFACGRDICRPMFPAHKPVCFTAQPELVLLKGDDEAKRSWNARPALGTNIERRQTDSLGGATWHRPEEPSGQKAATK